MIYHVGAGAAAAHTGLRLRIDSSLSGLCVRQGRTLQCHDAKTDERVDFEACLRVGAMSMVCVPLTHEGQVIGVLKVYDPRPNVFTPEDVESLHLLSGMIAAHMAHASDFQEHLHDSRHDPVTGLPNRRALNERLVTELARVRRHGGDLTLCLLDLDHFKQVNDTFGHPAEDAVLRAVAANLQLRGEDGANRLGGDEFAVVLVGAGPDGATTVTERLAESVAADPACRGVGVSCGVAAYEAGDDLASLVTRADSRLYEAKRQLKI